jgi:hypothetical protein
MDHETTLQINPLEEAPPTKARITVKKTTYEIQAQPIINMP